MAKTSSHPTTTPATWATKPSTSGAVKIAPPDAAVSRALARMVALRGGADAGTWTSSDGLAWQRLPVTGDLPNDQATQAVLLPGGVLLSDGTTTWFGDAHGP